MDHEEERDDTVPKTTAGRRARVILLALVVAFAAAGLLRAGGLDHTALLFVGIPAILAIIVVLTPRPASATGTILKAITIALLLSMILLSEGLVCVLFAAPIFYLVGVLIGLTADWARRRRGRSAELRVSALLVVILAVLSGEGVVRGFDFDRDHEVTATRTVPSAPAAVEAALAATPRFERELPAFLRLGFPRPGPASGAGLEEGDRRVIPFDHAGHHPGELVLEVASSEPGRVVFSVVADHTYITHWLWWREAEVRWRDAGEGATEVSWTLRYSRRLDPAWYFAPLERLGVGVAADYLIDALLIPRTD